MKQNVPSTVTRGDTKQEPQSTAINPGGVGNLGSHFGNHADCGDFRPRITPMDAGRGYSAPAIRSTSHKSGSQGEH